MIILEKASQRVPRHLSTKSPPGYISDVQSIQKCGTTFEYKKYSVMACSWRPTQAILKIQFGIPSLIKAISNCQNRCPATSITVTVTPNRSLFGIPISTSLIKIYLR